MVPAAPQSAAVAAQEMSSSSLTSSAGAAGIYIQAGAFARRGNAERVEAQIAGLGTVRVTTALVNGSQWYRVRLGPIGTRTQADALLARMAGSGYPGARIVGD
jgi:rare lipoprotein A